ncbi:MAG: competence/damage-inducible protein A [Bacteroidetes bacterium]|nr:competence/damage-inducible protein A [Bacteroidota bacterium]
MRAEILTIGDEILIGQITNTNSVWIAQQLNLLGIKVVHMSSVSDDKEAIIKAFDDAVTRAEFVFITGGLGPTKDDITKKTFAEYFNTILEIDERVLNTVKGFFERRNRELTEINRQQALVPKGCIVIENKNGTAPGMWMKKGNTVFISMPGVPYEMKSMMSELILPKIKSENKLPHIYHKTVLTQGLGESFLAEKIEKWEDALAENNIKLAYLPQPGIVRLRLSTFGENSEVLKSVIENEIEKLRKIIPEYIYGYENYGEDQPGLEKIVSELLRERKLRVSLAESCTGGYIASLFTSLAGSSDIFNGSIVPYQNQIKHELLHVDAALFETVGAVSKECVIQMANETRKKFHTDYAIATSGIAGPAGGTAEKPVGTVWVAVASPEKTIALKFLFGDNRQRNIQMTANAALNMLRKIILKQE